MKSPIEETYVWDSYPSRKFVRGNKNKKVRKWKFI